MSVLVYTVGSTKDHDLQQAIVEALGRKSISATTKLGVHFGLALIVQLRFKGIKCHVVARAPGDKKPSAMVLNELLKAGLAEFEEPFDLIDTTKEGTPSVELRIPEDVSPLLYDMWSSAVANAVAKYIRSLK
jgi:hypothetical protein